MANLIRQFHNRKNLLAQKAKLRWLKEGDVNSKMFHKAINARRRNNNVVGLEMGGEWVEEPCRVKEAVVRSHFSEAIPKEERSGGVVGRFCGVSSVRQLRRGVAHASI